MYTEGVPVVKGAFRHIADMLPPPPPLLFKSTYHRDLSPYTWYQQLIPQILAFLVTDPQVCTDSK